MANKPRLWAGGFEVMHRFRVEPSLPHDGLTAGPDGSFYGVCGAGGPFGFGAAFKINGAGEVTYLDPFTGSGAGRNGSNPRGPLLLAGDGNFYGIASAGGGLGGGTVFRLTPSGGLEVLADLGAPGGPGGVSTGTLVQGIDEALYGIAAGGGSASVGAIFKVTLAGAVSTVASFSNATTAGSPGAKPSSLVVDAAGNMYGVAAERGEQGYGTVFKLTPAGALAPLANFVGSSAVGDKPLGRLVFGSDGALYGTTTRRTANLPGTVFRCSLAGELSVVASFGTTVAAGSGSLHSSPDGSFLGVGTASGASVIYRVQPDGVLAPIVNFSASSPLGSGAGSHLVPDGAGNVLGVCGQGGANAEGTVFRISSAGLAEPLWSFSASDQGNNGFQPEGRLVESSDGKFYGTTYRGGQSDEGTIFEIERSGAFRPVFSFSSHGFPSGGTLPKGGLIRGNDGNFYGTTSAGGGGSTSVPTGALFRMTPAEQVSFVYRFSSNVGSNPECDLVEDEQGRFLGTALRGGSNSIGTIFRRDADGTVVRLHSFQTGSGTGRGALPAAGLVRSADGSYFGTTFIGGTGNLGTIFRLTPGGTFTALVDFQADGGPKKPVTGLTIGPDGELYGTSYEGGLANRGTVFRVTRTGSLSVLASFTGTGAQGNGAGPAGDLVLGGDGKLYGTTFSGGLHDRGTIFRITPEGVMNTLHAFSGADGEGPVAPLVFDQRGDFWGTAEKDALGGGGVVFRFVQAQPPVLGQVSALPRNPSAATFAAEIDPNLGTTSVLIEYGPTPAYGQTSTSLNAGSGDAPKLVEIVISGLAGHTVYHYRAIVSNAQGTVHSADATFTTPNTPPSAPDRAIHPPSGPINLVVFDVTEHSSDADGDPRTVTQVNYTGTGTVVFDPATVRFSPGAGYTGNETLTVTVSDGFGGSAVATIALTNAAPVASPDLALAASAGISIPVLANDSDPENDGLLVAGVGPAAFGAVSHDGTSVHYTPGAGFFGQDTFTYSISDLHGGLATGTVRIGLSTVLRKPLAQTGTALPGEPEGTVFRAFGAPSINDSGTIVAAATIARGRALSQVILAGHSPAIVARQGEAAPGADGGTFLAFQDPLINGAGRVAFRATLTGVAASSNEGIWMSDDTGGFALVARKGGTAPDLTGSRFGSFRSLALPPSGGLLLLARLAPGGGVTASNDEGLWTAATGGALHLRLREGSSIAVRGLDRTVKTIDLLGTVAGSPGQRRSFAAPDHLAARVSFADKSQALIRVGLDGIEVIAASGDTIDPVENAAIKSFGPIALGTEGQPAVRVLLARDAAEVTASSDVAILAADASDPLAPFARTGDTAPGTGGALWRTLNDPVAGSAGKLAFIGTLKSASNLVSALEDTAIWSNFRGALELFAREGGDAPECAGTKFSTFVSLAMSGLRGPAFVARLKPQRGLVTTANDGGLWAPDTSGTLRLLLREGEAVEVGAGTKTVASFSVLGVVLGSPGQGHSATPNGSFVLRLNFTDRSQTLLAIAVP